MVIHKAQVSFSQHPKHPLQDLPPEILAALALGADTEVRTKVNWSKLQLHRPRIKIIKKGYRWPLVPLMSPRKTPRCQPPYRCTPGGVVRAGHVWAIHWGGAIFPGEEEQEEIAPRPSSKNRLTRPMELQPGTERTQRQQYKSMLVQITQVLV